MSRKGGGARKCSMKPCTYPVESMCCLPRHAGCGPGGTPPFPVKNRCFVRKFLLRENIFSRHEKLFSRHDKKFSRHGKIFSKHGNYFENSAVCAVSVRVLTSESSMGSARRGCGPYPLRRQQLQGLRADGRDVEEEANVKS